jgi:isochorismate hydrolase
MTELPADWNEIAPEIKTEPTDIFITKKPGVLFITQALHQELQKRGVTQIVLAGVATSIGVEATARSANEFAYNIAFASDAMTDMFAEAHEHSFKYIFPRIGEVGTTAEIIEKLGIILVYLIIQSRHCEARRNPRFAGPPCIVCDCFLESNSGQLCFA